MPSGGAFSGVLAASPAGQLTQCITQYVTLKIEVAVQPLPSSSREEGDWPCSPKDERVMTMATSLPSLVKSC